jgi:hypothetical protein
MKCRFICLFVILFCSHFNLFAQGITVDVGLTPSQDRFILRAQYRYMSMSNSMTAMNTQMTPLVLAYGVTSGFTVMAKGMYVNQKVENTSNVTEGINDLFLLTKFRLYRKNTAKYVLGLSTFIASNIPIGSTKISNRSLNPEFGLNISFRPRLFFIDFSASYMLSDLSGKLASKPGNKLSINSAFSTLIPLKSNSSNAISPVLETTYTYQSEGDANPSNELLFFSPGISFIHSALSLEALVQIPVYQSENVNLMNQNSRLILGIKYMF